MNGVELVASWLTPTVIFCVVNLMIGAVFVISSWKTGKQPKTGDSEHVSPPQIVRVPSIFDRVSSIKLPFHRSENPYPVSSQANRSNENTDPAHQKPESKSSHVTRRKSDAGTNPTATATVMKKSASEKFPASEEDDSLPPASIPGRRAALGGGDEAVDARADDFIDRFRQQLKLQRLDSLLKYREMLKARGT